MTYTIILLIQVGLIFTISNHVSGFDNLQQLYIKFFFITKLANFEEIDISEELMYNGRKTCEVCLAQDKMIAILIQVSFKKIRKGRLSKPAKMREIALIDLD